MIASAMASLQDPMRFRNCSITQSAQQPLLPLDQYFSRIDSPTYHWVTELSLNGLFFSTADVLAIPMLRNLSALAIDSGRIESSDKGIVNDRILRTWAEQATTTGAFPILRHICLRSQRAITHASFTHLNSFKALNSFSVTDCDIFKTHVCIDSAKAAGWRLVDSSETVATDDTAGADHTPKLVFTIQADGISGHYYQVWSRTVLRFERIKGLVKPSEGKAEHEERSHVDGPQRKKQRVIKQGKKADLGGDWGGLF